MRCYLLHPTSSILHHSLSLIRYLSLLFHFCTIITFNIWQDICNPIFYMWPVSFSSSVPHDLMMICYKINIIFNHRFLFHVVPNSRQLSDLNVLYIKKNIKYTNVSMILINKISVIRYNNRTWKLIKLYFYSVHIKQTLFLSTTIGFVSNAFAVARLLFVRSNLIQVFWQDSEKRKSS